MDKDVTESVESLVVRTGGFSGAEVSRGGDLTP